MASLRILEDKNEFHRSHQFFKFKGVIQHIMKQFRQKKLYERKKIKRMFLIHKNVK